MFNIDVWEVDSRDGIEIRWPQIERNRKIVIKKKGGIASNKIVPSAITIMTYDQLDILNL
jgi:hypothetical protein